MTFTRILSQDYNRYESQSMYSFNSNDKSVKKIDFNLKFLKRLQK